MFVAVTVERLLTQPGEDQVFEVGAFLAFDLGVLAQGVEKAGQGRGHGVVILWEGFPATRLVSAPVCAQGEGAGASLVWLVGILRQALLSLFWSPAGPVDGLKVTGVRPRPHAFQSHRPSCSFGMR